MKIRTRIKAALTALLDPAAVKKPVFQIREREPSIVADNRLLAGKSALITGAGRNIGRSIAIEMAKQGANIFFTDLDSDSCAKLQEELAAYPVHAKGLVSDISKIQHIDMLNDFLSKNNAQIDILVHNASMHGLTIGIRDLNLEEWRGSFETNVFGPIYLTKLIADEMKAKRIDGCIIFLSSIHQWKLRSVPSYSASKAAIGMIIKELAAELAPFGIRVNGIAPGSVAEQAGGDPSYYERALLHKSSINPRYIGRAAVYLAAGYFSRFTTGTVLTIDGGLSLYGPHSDRYSAHR